MGKTIRSSISGMPYISKILIMPETLGTDNEAKAKIDESLAGLNMISAGTLYRSPRVWCNNKRPVSSPKDNTGIKMRAPNSPISLSFASAMGASPVSVAWAEVYTALSAGTVDVLRIP
jgi:TRAP-type C4-dicarboxylate transport system substrate-binding protein